MSRRIEGEDGKKSALNMRTTHALRSRMEQAAERSGRSLAQEAEFRLERSFDPVAERLCEIAVGNGKSALVIRALAAVFELISFEEGGFPTYLSRAALLSAFEAILEEHFPRPKGLMSDLSQPEDPAHKAKLEKRFRTLAEQITAQQRIALYGSAEPYAGLTLLQTAQVLGLLPTEETEAVKLLEGAAKAVNSKKKASAE